MGEASVVERAAARGAARQRFGRGTLARVVATHRPLVATGLFGCFLVLATGLTNGGYASGTWPAVSVVAAGAAGIALLNGASARLTPYAIAGLGSSLLLATWIALSGLWAIPGADTVFEAKRAGMYAVALGATVVLARMSARWLVGGLVVGIGTICLVALVMRLVAGVPADPLFGSLLEEPVGYPNTLGVLAAVGFVLAVGLALAQPRPRAVGLALRGAAPVMLLVLGLSQSRGALVALVAGLAFLLVLAPAPARPRAAGLVVVSSAVGLVAWVVAESSGGAGVGLVSSALLAAVGGALLSARAPALGHRTVATALCALVIAGAATAALEPTLATSSLRTAYWGAALREFGEHPLRGAGAGSFHLTWQERRTVETEVRDGHSLYVETLSELGLVGLALVTGLVFAPLLAAWRRRGDILVSTVGAGFAVFAIHAGLDWDWEMPVVTLVGLGCAGVLLASGSTVQGPSQHRIEGRGWE